MGTIKDRNGMDLTEAGDTKKRWQEHTEKLHKKDPDDPNNHDSVITHLQTNIPALLTMPKPLPAWITINCGKFLRR